MRKVKILFIMCILGCMFVGCQKDTVQYINPTEAPNSGNEQEFDFEDDEELEDSQEYEEDVQPSKSPTEKYKHFDADEGWKELTGYEYAVQVDDILYIPGITAEEFINKVESSSVSYTYEYNGKRLLINKEEVEIMISRDGMEWFRVIVRNPWDDTKEMSELPVVKIVPSAKAEHFCHFIDGRSYEDIISMSYSDVKKLADEKFSGVSEEKTDSKGLSMIIAAELKIELGKGYTFHDTCRTYVFCVNSENGMVSSIGQGEKIGHRYLTSIPREPITSFSDLKVEEEAILNIVKENLDEYDEIEILESYLLGNSQYVACIVFVKTGIDYAWVQMREIGRNFDDGKFECGTIDMGEPYWASSYAHDLEKYTEHLLKGINVLDKKVYKTE